MGHYILLFKGSNKIKLFKFFQKETFTLNYYYHYFIVIFISKGIEPSAEAFQIAEEKAWHEYKDVARERLHLCIGRMT